MKKLLYIDQLVGPTSLDIINALSKFYEVHLYCGGIIHTYAALDERVIYHKQIPYNKKTFILRLFSWFAFYVGTVPVVILQRKKEVFFLVSNPPLNFFLGFVLARLFRVSFSLLMFDIYPDIIVQSKYLSSGNAIVRLWSYLNRISFRNAYRIFTISENLAREVRKYLPPDAANLRVVPNWVDSEEIRPLPKDENPFIRQLGLQGKFVIMYSGNMGQTHALETIVETARRLSHLPEIQFLLIGDGAKKSKIVKMVDEWKLTNVKVLPFQDPAVFKHSIASADIGFVTLSEGFEAYSVPSKTYYLMAAGCIVFAIANEKSEVQNLLTQYKFGYRFDPDKANEVAEKILEIYRDHDLLGELRINARNAASFFTLENANIIAREVGQG